MQHFIKRNLDKFLSKMSKTNTETSFLKYIKT